MLPESEERKKTCMSQNLLIYPLFLVGLGRISGRLPDIEIIRPDIWYCWIFSFTLLKLSGQISDNLVL